MSIKDFKHLMIDIETLDTIESAVILSVAIVPFNLESGEMDTHYYFKGDSRTAVLNYRTISTDTIEWWMLQDISSRREALMGQRLECHMLAKEVAKVLYEADPDMIVWSKSPAFDLVILKHLFRQWQEEWPFSPRNERDVRTYINMLPNFVSKVPAPDRSHNPVVDCFYQVAQVHEVWEEIDLHF